MCRARIRTASPPTVRSSTSSTRACTGRSSAASPFTSGRPARSSGSAVARGRSPATASRSSACTSPARPCRACRSSTRSPTSTATTWRAGARTGPGTHSTGAPSTGRARCACARASRQAGCSRATRGQHYLSDPGEGFADGYAHVHYPEVPWQYNPILRPDRAAFAAIRRDVLHPWTGPRSRTFRGRLGQGRGARRFHIRMRARRRRSPAPRGARRPARRAHRARRRLLRGPYRARRPRARRRVVPAQAGRARDRDGAPPGRRGPLPAARRLAGLAHQSRDQPAALAAAAGLTTRRTVIVKPTLCARRSWYLRKASNWTV